MTEQELQALYGKPPRQHPDTTPTPPRQIEKIPEPVSEYGALVFSPSTHPDIFPVTPTPTPTPVGVLAKTLQVSDRTIQRYCKTLNEVFGWEVASPFNFQQVQLLTSMAFHCSDRWTEKADLTKLEKRLKPREYCEQLQDYFRNSFPDAPKEPDQVASHDLTELEDELDELIAASNPEADLGGDLKRLDDQDSRLVDRLVDRLDPRQRKARVIDQVLTRLNRPKLSGDR